MPIKFPSFLSWTLSLGFAGCVDDFAQPDVPSTEEIPPGQPYSVQLRFLRLDVRNYEHVLTQQDLQDASKFPRKILEDVWLLDFEMRDSVVQVLEQLSALSSEEAAKLSPAAQNLRRLLNMTADNADLTGTKLEEMIGLAGSVGIPPAKVLAALVSDDSKVDVSARVIPFDIAADVMLELVLGSHPNAQTRKGKVDAMHPDGVWEVRKGTLPITMWDVVSNFKEMETKFGPAGEHPGFITSITGIDIGKDSMAMRVRANLNALPYKGIDLTTGYVASVNSTASQIGSIFDFSDSEWLKVDGLTGVVKMGSITVSVTENAAFQPGGDIKEPLPGNSPIWDLPSWEFERLLIEMARRRTELIEPDCDEYKLGTDVLAFKACVDEAGWTTMETFTDIGNPPPPAYFWDILAEVAQVRLHDGNIPEGQANAEFTLKDVEVVLDEKIILDRVRQNIQENPQALARLAELLNNNGDGNADFFYYRPLNAKNDQDYLYFVTPQDIQTNIEGLPVRPYKYEHPGFYADADLKTKISSTAEIDNDTSHEKLKVYTGQTMFVEDDVGHIFQIVVGDKPNRSAVSLELTRVR